jgi:starch phosphorylase
MDSKIIVKHIKKKLAVMFSQDVEEASSLQKYIAIGNVVKDYCSENMMATKSIYKRENSKKMCYFSMEFLIGRLLESNLINLGIREQFMEALEELGIDFEEIRDMETDPGLGNGGLGRLAACFLDSLASLGFAGYGCGIRYQYGLFDQKIVDGYQVEVPDNWLKNGNVWERRNIEKSVMVGFGGEVEFKEVNGIVKPVNTNCEFVKAVPYDITVVGYENGIANNLRLWSAETVDDDFDFSTFSQGDYSKAFENKSFVTSVCQVLYPNDSSDRGKILRLKQEYFLVSAGIQSIVRSYEKKKLPFNEFHEHIAIHINDTHPALAIPELMRILMDEKDMGWEEAFEVTSKTMAYTNHTIMTEALEKWHVPMLKSIVPRIYMIIEEINKRFLAQVVSDKGKPAVKPADVTVIQNGYINMAYLAIIGSHSVNGVAKVHSELLKHQVLNNFYKLYPEKFNNKTNGITHRRWLMESNPRLASAITEVIGNEWIKNPNELIKLREYEDSADVAQLLGNVKKKNKIGFSNYVLDKYGMKIDPDSIFDVHIKRLHSYKRQLLNVMNIMDLYNRLLENPELDIVPRTFIFGAKASPSYYLAKQIIKLINSTGEKINSDRNIKDKIKVVFLENYGVSIAEKVIPAADVSQQISTASKEASGTGNMKLMMNGAVTLATLDGANIEIAEKVGRRNIVLFGLTVKEVINYYKNGGYSSKDIFMNDERIQKIVNQWTTGFLNVADSEFNNICHQLLPDNDEFFVFKDFASYVEAQNKIDKLYSNKKRWQKMSLINTACSGAFSSDNTIKEYARDIWGLKRV